MSAVLLEIQAAPPQSGEMFFPPLLRSLRGEIRVAECPEADAVVMREWSRPIPGLLVGLTAEGKGYVRDPLYGPEWNKLREWIKEAKLVLPPEVQEVTADRPTWLFWMRRCVEAGLARVTQGELPTPQACQGATKSFVVPERPNPEKGKNNKLLALLVARLPKVEREAYLEVLGELEEE